MFYALVIIAVAVLMIVFGPLAVIWALNALFPVLAIPFTFKTWFAVVLLNLTWFSKNFVKFNKE